MSFRPILPGFDPQRSDELAARLEKLSIEDLLRVLAATAHVLHHRRPDISTSQLAVELAAAIDDVHRIGLP